MELSNLCVVWTTLNIVILIELCSEVLKENLLHIGHK